MNKSLYSLILNDEVVKRIDNAAIEMGTNRSNLINQILADYVSYTTPERRIQHIFEHISSLLSTSPLQLASDNSAKSMSLKTSLDCRYHPTVRYSVELYRIMNERIGELKVSYRTHSEEILYKINEFFSIIIDIERKYLSYKAVYEITEGKFVRTFVIPYGNSYTQEEIARGISDYIKNFDYLFKKYLSGKYLTLTEMEIDYKIYLSKSILI